MDGTKKVNLAMQEMRRAGLPVEGYGTCAKGFDFIFARDLTEAEAEQAQEIANRNLPTNYHWHND